MILKGLQLLTLISFVLILTSCGGGGGSSSSSTPTPVPIAAGALAPTFQSGVFNDSDTYKDICLAPRSGTDPATSEAFIDQLGTTMHENMWLRSWTNELYLWYDEVNYQDPSNFNNPITYFNTLKTNQLTPSGTAKDKFHFTADTEGFFQLSQSGVSTGYGMQFKVFITSLTQTLPRDVVISYVEPGSVAELAGIQRGTNLISVDGIDLRNSSQSQFEAIINSALYPSSAGQSHNFVIRQGGAITTTEITMNSTNVTTSPVLLSSTIPTNTGNVGYLMFTQFIATAESALYSAFTQLAADNVSDLVLDMRYNNGGFLFIAAQLAYMIAGPTDTADKVFEEVIFNDKYPGLNPVTGDPIAPLPFISETVGLDSTIESGLALPTLGLRRVYILTTSSTCSASESVINGLRGIGVEVILIGSTTCGKPYGFYSIDNCGTTYFSIQFKGVNAIGFGDYTDGFSPQNASLSTGELIAGCEVGDDLTHALGDPLEANLKAALNYRDTMSCPIASDISIINSGPLPALVSSSNPNQPVFSSQALPGKATEAGLEMLLQNPQLINDRILGIPK